MTSPVSSSDELLTRKSSARRLRKPEEKYKRLLGVSRCQASVLKHGMFPTALLPRPRYVYRNWTMKGLMRAMEHALLSRNWKRAGLLAIGAFKYMFLEPHTLNKNVRAERLTSYEAGVAMVLEVFLHLPGADANAKCLLDSCTRNENLPHKVRRRITCALLRMFLLACKGQYEHASEALQATNRYKLYMRRGMDRSTSNLLFAKGVLFYGMWLKSLQEIKSSRIDCGSIPARVPIHFETLEWVKGNTHCTQLGHTLKISLEGALRTIPAVDGFCKLAHYYAVMGDWEAARETSARCRELFPLDADAHTLFYCILTACGEEESDCARQSEAAFSACESLVSILRCDPMCTQAARQLVKTGQNNWQFKERRNPGIQVLVVEGLLYRMDMFPLASRRKLRPQVTPGQDNVGYDFQAWEDLAMTLIGFTCVYRREAHLFTASWDSIEMLLKHRCEWWKKWVFCGSDLVVKQFGLEDGVVAKFLATVCICSFYVLGVKNYFARDLLEALEGAGWRLETKWAKKARSILTKARERTAVHSSIKPS